MAVSQTGREATGYGATPASKSDEAGGFYRLATLVLIIIVLYFGKAVLVPFALAILFTFALVPAVTWLERLRLGRPTAVAIIILCGLSVTCSLGWIVQREIAEVAKKWPEYRVSLHGKFRDIKRWADRLEGIRTEITETLAEEPTPGTPPLSQTPVYGPTTQPERPSKGAAADRDNAPPVPVRISPEPGAVIESVALYVEALMTRFAAALLVVVMLVFMLLTWEDLRDRAMSLISRSRLQDTKDTVNEAAKRVSRFLVAQSIINVSFGAMAAVGLWAIHLTLGGRASVAVAITAGFVCGVLRFVPYVGVWIGASIPLAFTFAVYPNNAVFLVTLAMFLLLEVLTAQFIEPRWLGASVGISPTGIMASTIFWSWLWGPMGLLLATPLTVLLVVIGKHLPKFRYLYILLADRRERDALPHP